MKDINVTIVLTTNCNMCCKYCINDSGNDLVPENSNTIEWSSTSDILSCLCNLSKVRNIKFIKFFGGEPMLRFDLIQGVVENKYKYSTSGDVKFALTTNAYKKFTSSILDFIIQNKIILNLSLDGPEVLNNTSRISKDGGNCFEKVIENINLLRKNNYPFALIGVLDERVLDFEMTILDISNFLSQYTPIYKIDPAYIVNDSNIISNFRESNNMKKLLNLQAEFIDFVFKKIKSLEEKHYVYENNVLRTMYNMVYNNKKEYVCSASDHVAIFPDKSSYSCYNLMQDKYLISENISKVEKIILENKLYKQKELLRIDKFPEVYKQVEFFGDYCPKENNFNSFAYIYRKQMIENILSNLKTIEPGSYEHLSLINYLHKGFSYQYFENTGEY